MGKQKSLKVNFIMNSVLTMSSFIFPLITFPYISRILLPEGTGKISFISSVISYFLLFSQLGIPSYGMRCCAKVRDDKEKLSRTVHELLFINLLMCVLCYGVLFILILITDKLYAEKTLFVIFSSTIILTAIGIEWLYKGLEKYTYITVRSLIFKIIALIAMFFLVHSKDDYIIYGSISIFASSASNIFNFFNARKYITFRYLGGYNIEKHFKPVAIFFAMSCATTIYTNLDTVMLGFMTSNTDVGYYNAAVKIKSILVSVVTSLGAVLLPRSSYYAEHNRIDELQSLSKKALNFVILIALPLTIYFILFAESGIYFLSGTEFEGSILPMQIIMPTLLFIGITNILGLQILIPTGREKIVLYSEIAGAIADLVLNIILIPKYAAAGAAFGTLIAEFVVLLVQFMTLRNEMKETIIQIKFKDIVLSVMVALLSGILMKHFQTNYLMTLVLSGCVFFFSYFTMLLFTKETLTLELFGQIKNRINFRR